jgi:hypothetical protein
MLRNYGRKSAALALLVVAVLISSCGSSSRSTVPADQKASADGALTWLRAQLQNDGSFNVGFGHPAGVTCDAVLAIVAAGQDPARWRAADGLPSMVDYLSSSASEYAVDAATTGKLIVAAVAAGQDARSFGGVDWVARLQALALDGKTYDEGSVGQAWAILALKAAGRPVPSAAVEVLKSYQLETGAWASPFGPDNDTVSYVLQALKAGGEPVDSTPIQRALSFFEQQQNEDGGFPAIKPSDWGTDSNANSTASVIMALNALGQNPTGERWTQLGGNPMKSLLTLQSDDGRIEFQSGVGEPLLSTVQAIPALMNASLPLRAGR